MTVYNNNLKANKLAAKGLKFSKTNAMIHEKRRKEDVES